VEARPKIHEAISSAPLRAHASTYAQICSNESDSCTHPSSAEIYIVKHASQRMRACRHFREQYLCDMVLSSKRQVVQRVQAEMPQWKTWWTGSTCMHLDPSDQSELDDASDLGFFFKWFIELADAYVFQSNLFLHSGHVGCVPHDVCV
jgi:hypothetical protein